jgi:hypothetical protein
MPRQRLQASHGVSTSDRVDEFWGRVADGVNLWSR